MNAHAETGDRSVVSAPMRAFLAQAALWNLALFALIRTAWFDEQVIGRLIAFQTTLAFWYGAPQHASIVVDSSCSGADVMALCAGVLLAYPLPWRRRVVGALLGTGLVLVLNVMRIGTLHAVTPSSAAFDLLHVYVWPAMLACAALFFVVAWIRPSASTDAGRRWVRFALMAVVALVVHAAVTPWVLTNPAVLEAGAATASSAALLLGALGATATSAGAVIVTARGAFEVTQQCLFTPVIPLYAAAVVSQPLSPRRRIFWIALALPIFFALGVARVLVLALPARVVESPVVLAHGFYQVLVGAILVIAAAHLGARGTSGFRASARTAGALGLAIVGGVVAARVWEPLLLAIAGVVQVVIPQTLTTLVMGEDPQRALALFPSGQVALLVGLWFGLTGGTRRMSLAGGLVLLALLQVCALAAFGSAAAAFDVTLHALVIRAWTLAVPVALAAALWTGAGATRVGDGAYWQFWDDVGREFPSLTGAASTTYYFENECRLIEQALPSMDGCLLLKTDLWDEAKNTRIMQWAADQGARIYGVDLSEPIVREARAAFGPRSLHPAVGDVRRLPFADAAFDAVYSMGTIEHFAESEAAVVELARVLKPGGRLVLGVPNRHDPFLRPLMVAVLYRLGLYGYGYEKSYSRRSLRRMIEATGLRVTVESGILFMPGWLRMIDLWCHTRMRPLAVVTGALVQPFVWLDRRVSWLRRHGYLIASVGVKPGVAAVGAGSHSPAGGAAGAGIEYVIDAHGCGRDPLRSLVEMQRLFAQIVSELDLRPVAEPVWHVFAGEGGVTGVVVLAESHLTIHTYPERNLATLNLYCCRPAAAWPWESRLRERLGARSVTVRTLRRG